MITPVEGQVVQFNENHKWRGAFGFVREVKKVKTEDGEDFRIMVGATMPDNGIGCSTAYIYSMLSNNEFDLVGNAVLMPGEVEDE